VAKAKKLREPRLERRREHAHAELVHSNGEAERCSPPMKPTCGVRAARQTSRPPANAPLLSTLSPPVVDFFEGDNVGRPSFVAAVSPGGPDASRVAARPM
jgi:hypothetical protein